MRMLNSWNTAKVIVMTEMFYGNGNFNQPLNSWNTANVEHINSMFHGATNFDQNISQWNVGKVTNYTNFRKGGCPLSNDNTPSKFVLGGE